MIGIAVAITFAVARLHEVSFQTRASFDSTPGATQQTPEPKAHRARR